MITPDNTCCDITTNNYTHQNDFILYNNNLIQIGSQCIPDLYKNMLQKQYTSDYCINKLYNKINT